MNPLQKLWMTILSPIAPFVNNKLSTTWGLPGRLGRFWQIGPREYGVHPTSKITAFTLANAGQRHSTFKNIKNQHFHNIRTWKFNSAPWLYLPIILWFAVPLGTDDDNNTYNIAYINNRLGNIWNISPSALNQKTSAHYIEINYIYGAEMAKRYFEMKKKIAREREFEPTKVKHTKYALKNYQYQERVEPKFN